MLIIIFGYCFIIHVRLVPTYPKLIFRSNYQKYYQLCGTSTTLLFKFSYIFFIDEIFFINKVNFSRKPVSNSLPSSSTLTLIFQKNVCFNPYYYPEKKTFSDDPFRKKLFINFVGYLKSKIILLDVTNDNVFILFLEFD